jgi:hypothetical protein
VVLDVSTVVDVRLVPGDVRMAEQHDVGSREPASEPGGTPHRRPAVVRHRDQASADLDFEPLGQLQATVVVAEHRVHGRDRAQSLEHVLVNDVAGMEDGVDVPDQIGIAKSLDQSSALACAQVRVGNHQSSPDVGHLAILVGVAPTALTSPDRDAGFTVVLPGTRRAMAADPTDSRASAHGGDEFDAVDTGTSTSRGEYPIEGVPSDNTTLVGVLQDLEEQGFGSQLIPRPDATIRCGACGETLSATEFDVEAVRRLEGASDPDDMMIVIGARCPRCGAAGTLVLGYGPNASEDDAAISAALDGLRA